MKTMLKIAFVVICLAYSAFSQDLTGWVNYTSAEGRYNVSLPLLPTLGQQESTTAEGKKFPQYKASAADGNGLFMVSYFDYTAPTTFSFDKARDGMIKAVKGTLISEDSISLGGWPGRQIVVTTTGKDGLTYLIRAKYYDAGGRIYVLQYLFPKDGNDPAVGAKANKFFDSFSVKSQG